MSNTINPSSAVAPSFYVKLWRLRSAWGRRHRRGVYSIRVGETYPCQVRALYKQHSVPLGGYSTVGRTLFEFWVNPFTGVPLFLPSGKLMPPLRSDLV